MLSSVKRIEISCCKDGEQLINVALFHEYVSSNSTDDCCSAIFISLSPCLDPLCFFF